MAVGVWGLLATRGQHSPSQVHSNPFCNAQVQPKQNKTPMWASLSVFNSLCARLQFKKQFLRMPRVVRAADVLAMSPPEVGGGRNSGFSGDAGGKWVAAEPELITSLACSR